MRLIVKILMAVTMVVLVFGVSNVAMKTDATNHVPDLVVEPESSEAYFCGREMCPAACEDGMPGC